MQSENGNIPVHVSSGVTGEIYSSYLVSLTGSEDVVNVTGYYSGESEVTKASSISSLNNVPGKIVFTKPIIPDETIEIYSHNGFLNNLSFNAGKEINDLGSGGTAGLSRRSYGIKNSDLVFDSALQPQLKLYRNGLFLQEVSGLHDTSEIFKEKPNSVGGGFKGDYFIDDPRENPVKDISYQVILNDQNDGFSSQDDVIYDVYSGATLTGAYSGISAHFTGEYYNEFLNPGKDIYLNGVKLLSGRDYSKSEVSHNGEVKLSYFLDANRLGQATGVVLFVPQVASVPENFTRTTGQFYNTGLTEAASVPLSNIFFEQVWRNGLRQTPGVDYVRFSEDSIATGISGASSINDSFVFNESRINVDVQVEGVISNDKEKIFSLSSDEDLNFLS